MESNNILELKARNKIYNLIKKKPGLHFRKISRILNIPISTLRYHLRYLNKRQLIITRDDGGFIRYYIANSVGNADKKMIKILRLKTPRNIILYLFNTVGVSQKELSEELEKHPNTIQFHLKKLLELDIIEIAETKRGVIFTKLKNNALIERSPVGREKFYILKDPHQLYDIFIKYSGNKLFDDKITYEILDYVNHMCPGDPPKKLTSKKQIIKKVEDIFYDIFPHPYHV